MGGLANLARTAADPLNILPRRTRDAIADPLNILPRDRPQPQPTTTDDNTKPILGG